MLAGWVEDGDPEADSFDAIAITMAGTADIDEGTDFTDERKSMLITILSQLLLMQLLRLALIKDDVTRNDRR
uniref:Uncharacterized protein n=1 Tax=Salmonella sp. TaxID=599 RepID=A0A482ET48_SALSP|nr:hypothetical protein [Salmonella sp.]QBM91358.1 hypothetical protein NNIBIDOC_00025 [Salmonella sp.]